MKKCPACGAEYDVIDAICPVCEAELPAPYEAVEEKADDLESEQVEAAETAGGLLTGNSTDQDLSVLGLPTWRLSGQIPPEAITILSGAEVFTGDGSSHNPGTVAIAGGRIIGILDRALANPEDGSNFFDLSGKILAPGFVDIHVHGMMGIDTNHASLEDFQRFSTEAARHGTTAFIPTTVACSPEELGRVLNNLHEARERGTAGARLLGLHMESNFISPQFKGSQPPEQIFSPDDSQAWTIKQLIDEYAHDIRIVTVAPEVSGAIDFIDWLVERNVIASLGHSAATYEQAIAGIDAGATHATHLFNAMAPLHHRNPGLVGAALERDEVFTEVVCDGIHIHPAVLSVIFSAKGADRVMAVSDALEGAGMEAGYFFLGGQHVTIVEGVARLDNGTIAGSMLTSDTVLRNLVGLVGWDLGEALMMVSSTPAAGLGMQKIGQITEGAVADLVILDQELTVEYTLVGGEVVYQR